MRLREIIEQHDEYAGLEDADEFSSDVQHMGTENVGPHVFDLTYYRRGDYYSLVVNHAYEFSINSVVTMPRPQMLTVLRDIKRLRPDIAKELTSVQSVPEEKFLPYWADLESCPHAWTGMIFEAGILLLEPGRLGELDERRREDADWEANVNGGDD
jgi:hypothetical protein